jgi:hypothetical protein
MQNEGYSPAMVNLDPGAEALPYDCDADIREFVSLQGAMEEYGLGPNGAQVAAADLMALNAGKMAAAIDAVDADYFILDTPGQIELFAFRSSSRVLVDAIGRERAMLAFLFDPNLVKQPTGFASAQLLAATVEFRMSLPTLNVLSKADLLTDEETARVSEWGTEPASLLAALDAEPGAPHVPLTNELIKALESLGITRPLTFASAETGVGCADIYSMGQALFDGGEDLENKSPRPS